MWEQQRVERMDNFILKHKRFPRKFSYSKGEIWLSVLAHKQINSIFSACLFFSALLQMYSIPFGEHSQVNPDKYRNPFRTIEGELGDLKVLLLLLKKFSKSTWKQLFVFCFVFSQGRQVYWVRYQHRGGFSCCKCAWETVR